MIGMVAIAVVAAWAGFTVSQLTRPRRPPRTRVTYRAEDSIRKPW